MVYPRAEAEGEFLTALLSAPGPASGPRELGIIRVMSSDAGPGLRRDRLDPAGRRRYDPGP